MRDLNRDVIEFNCVCGRRKQNINPIKSKVMLLKKKEKKRERNVLSSRIKIKWNLCVIMLGKRNERK